MSAVLGRESDNHQETHSPSYSPTSHNRKRSGNHIPRPPNAFLLYRSHFLKKELIPKHVETKQQTLSRVVGECWRRLPADTKEEWHAHASAAKEEHAKKYPKYVYKPVRRQNPPRKRQKQSEEEKRRRCEELRQVFLPETMEQSPVESHVSPKKRKSRAKKKPKHDTVITSSSSNDGQISVVTPTDSVFMEPLVAPSNLSQRSLEEFHGSMMPEFSASDLGFFDFHEEHPAYGDEYFNNNLGIENVASVVPAISQPPVASIDASTTANELRERFQRDQATGAITTTAMFNDQYMDQSFFMPQSGFFPAPQAGPSSGLANTSEAIFQDLLLRPSCFMSHQSGLPQIQGSENAANIHESFARSFPFSVQSQSELPDLGLVNPIFNLPADTSDININMGNFLTGLNLATSPGNFVQEVPPSIFGDVFVPPATNELQNWNELDNFLFVHET